MHKNSTVYIILDYRILSVSPLRLEGNSIHLLLYNTMLEVIASTRNKFIIFMPVFVYPMEVGRQADNRQCSWPQFQHPQPLSQCTKRKECSQSFPKSFSAFLTQVWAQGCNNCSAFPQAPMNASITWQSKQVLREEVRRTHGHWLLD